AGGGVGRGEGGGAERPRGVFAPPRRAEDDEVGAPLGGFGNDRLGGLADQSVQQLARGRDARHAKLEDPGLDYIGRCGFRLGRVAAAANALAKIEVQDACFAGARTARELCGPPGLACVQDWYEPSAEDLSCARGGVSRRYLVARGPSVRAGRSVARHCATLLTSCRPPVLAWVVSQRRLLLGSNCKAFALDSE